MATYTILVLTVMASLAQSQRPSFAGLRSIGFPQMEAEPIGQLSNRFGEDAPVPIEAKGQDRSLINKIEQMPIDSRPFWYINALQYDDLRQRPQTWPLKANNFISK